MLVEPVIERVGDVPHLTPDRARRLHSFLLEHRLGDILEMGFAHGTSTCYLAAAAEELGGHVTTLDRPYVLERDPNIHQLLDRVGLADRASVILTHTYVWPLRAMLRDQLKRGSGGTFDFVFLDGAHIWEVDALAFLLADRLLRPGGWILLDDLNWSIDASPSMRTSTLYEEMSDEFRQAQQVQDVFDLLVRPHGDYDRTAVTDDGNWGWARKRAADVWYDDGVPVRTDLRQVVRKVARRTRAAIEQRRQGQED